MSDSGASPESLPTLGVRSEHVTAALRAGLRIEHMSEHIADAELAATHPRAEKYVGWPLLLVMKATPGG